VTPAAALLACAMVALVCATVAYVARLLVADRASARERRALVSDTEFSALRDRVNVLAKQTAEHKAALANGASRGVRK
jgi:hypothetical protein